MSEDSYEKASVRTDFGTRWSENRTADAVLVKLQWSLPVVDEVMKTFNQMQREEVLPHLRAGLIVLGYIVVDDDPDYPLVLAHDYGCEITA